MCLSVALCSGLELKVSQETLTACQKSAEGIVVGSRPARVLRHFERKLKRTDKPNRSPKRRPERCPMINRVNGVAIRNENS